MENSIFVSMVPSSGTILTNHLSDPVCSDLNVKLRMPELPDHFCLRYVCALCMSKCLKP